MTAVTLIFFTLFTWMVSSGTQLRWDLCSDNSQCEHDEERKGFSFNTTLKNTAIHDKTRLTLKFARYFEMNAALRRNFSQERVEKDSTLSLCVTLNSSNFNGRVNQMKRVKKTWNGEMPNRNFCKCKNLLLFSHFLSKRSCVLLTRISSDNNSTHLSIPVTHNITLLLFDLCKTTHGVCMACELQIKILQSRSCKELGPAFPKCLIIILPENQVILMTAEKSQRAFLRSNCIQMPSTLYGQQENLPTQAGRMDSLQPIDATKWDTIFSLAAVLLLGIYRRRLKLSPNRVSPAHASNSTMMVLISMTLHSFSPSATLQQPSEWSHTSIRMSCACALGRTVRVITSCRTALSVLRLYANTHVQFRALPVLVLLIWLTVSPSFVSKCVKLWFEDLNVENSYGLMQKCWSELGQVEPLAALCCLLASLLGLFHSIRTKTCFLSILLNVRLVTCLQSPRVPKKYVLVIKLSRLI